MKIVEFCKSFAHIICLTGGLLAFWDYLYFSLTGSNFDYSFGFFVGVFIGACIGSAWLTFDRG